jgi:hypothetical protein
LANILDYMNWRGDLSLQQSGFNEVDNLILAQLSYVDFKNIVPAPGSTKSITLKEASRVFFSIYDIKEILAQVSLTKKSALVLEKMARCDRFANMKLSWYVNEIDPAENKQFSAINIGLDDGTVYVAYRGTDDSIVGWKEDLCMSFLSFVPAQVDAVRYLEETAGGTGKKLRIGGHSKGGNLAVYAAVKCSSEIKDRIIEVYNNDGPGFEREMTESEEYRQVRSKIRTIVPQSSIIGMLLEHEDEYAVIKSNTNGIRQHDPLSWEVLGKQFFYVDNLTQRSKFLDETLKAWVSKLDKSQREQFVESLFDVLEELQVKNIADFSRGKFRKLGGIIKAIGNMPPENKKVLSQTIRQLFAESGEVLRNWNRISG